MTRSNCIENDASSLTMEELLSMYPNKGAEIHRGLKTGTLRASSILLSPDSLTVLEQHKEAHLLRTDSASLSDLKSSVRRSLRSTNETANSSETDCWGRIPEKDVITTCSNCSKQISAIRFAAHLEKCLQLKTSRHT